jgi:hypothetical protein
MAHLSRSAAIHLLRGQGGSVGRACAMFKRSDQAVEPAAALGLKFPTIRQLRARVAGGVPVAPANRLLVSGPARWPYCFDGGGLNLMLYPLPGR